MDARTRILRTLQGQPVEGVPWSTYPSQAPAGEAERDFRNHGLAINRVLQLCTRVMPNVEVIERQVWEQGQLCIYKTYRTPVGEVHEKQRFDPGYGSRWTIEHMIRRPEDYRVVEFMVRDTQLALNEQAILDQTRELGNDGVVMVWASRSPYRQLEIELAGLERTALDRADGVPELDALRVALEEQHEAIYRLAAASPASLIWCPDNLTDLVVGRRLFETYYAPYYDRYARLMREAGKTLVCHFDGRLASLVGAIGRTELPVIEAFTPPPMGDVSVAEAKAAWPDKVIWANFPGSVFLQKPAEITAFTLGLLREAMPGGRFILGVTEDIPINVRVPALRAMAEGIQAYEREM